MRWGPHNYQKTALSFLLSNARCGLFLDPGLGKTSTSLSAIQVLTNAEEVRGVLLIAPLCVINSVWPDEVEKWSNFNQITYTTLHGEGRGALWGEQKDIYLINPEGLAWLHQELIAKAKVKISPPFNALWVDESTKFKNHKSTRFKLLKSMLPLFKRRHIMTGTPAPKSYLDLWSQIYLLDEGAALGETFYQFRNNYFEATDWNQYNYRLKEGADWQIQKAVSHLVLNMAASNYLNLPDISYHNIKVELPTKALKQYKTMEKEFFAQIDSGVVTAASTAVSGLKCRQLANGNIYEDLPEEGCPDELSMVRRNRNSYVIHREKIEALKNLINELHGKPLLVAYHFKHDLHELQKALGDVPCIKSGVSALEQKDIEDRWNAGLIPVLLGHPVKMAHGLNLQKGGKDVCWYSMTWDLEEYMQFNARVYRQGVSGSCRVYHLVASDTIDQAMLLRLKSKKDGQDGLRQALDQYRSDKLNQATQRVGSL